MIETYVYFDQDNSRLHLFKRDEKYLPVGTIKDVKSGTAHIELWAPLVFSTLGANTKQVVNIKASIVALSRKTGVLIKSV